MRIQFGQVNVKNLQFAVTENGYAKKHTWYQFDGKQPDWHAYPSVQPEVIFLTDKADLRIHPEAGYADFYARNTKDELMGLFVPMEPDGTIPGLTELSESDSPKS